MNPRWMVERKYANKQKEVLTIIEVYAPGEKKEQVKEENKQWSYKKELLLGES